jgi:hypothetical protein
LQAIVADDQLHLWVQLQQVLGGKMAVQANANGHARALKNQKRLVTNL